MKCRSCTTELEHIFIDLVNAPASNSYLKEDQLEEPEVYYPLKIYVCHSCFLVQIEEYKKSSEIFSKEYAYFSSYSTSWLVHAKMYVEMISERLNLDEHSSVVEIASNDGYLLQYFLGSGISCFGVEPTASTADAARKKGIETVEEFFTVETSRELIERFGKQDLILGNNVLAHVPDILDFVKGASMLLAPEGTITFEFPHLLNLIEQNQFDTIYHEHFSYLSLYALQHVFKKHALVMYDVEKLSTHGGSLRVYLKHTLNLSINIEESVGRLIEEEKAFGLNTIEGYLGFSDKVKNVAFGFMNFLHKQHQENKMVVAYGAAAKGNTFLNYCGIKGNDLIQFVVDASPYKKGKYLPGSHIPIVDEKKIKETRPDFIIVFPWNIQSEIVKQLSYVEEWGGKFVVAIPQIQVL